jgi:hypothetical protein
MIRTTDPHGVEKLHQSAGRHRPSLRAGRATVSEVAGVNWGESSTESDVAASPPWSSLGIHSFEAVH